MNNWYLIIANELIAIRLAPTYIHHLPLPEYTDLKGTVCWLWEDLAP
jgi:hypothetical protein